jgi:hypothetical protein
MDAPSGSGIPLVADMSMAFEGILYLIDRRTKFHLTFLSQRW